MDHFGPNPTHQHESTTKVAILVPFPFRPNSSDGCPFENDHMKEKGHFGQSETIATGKITKFLWRIIWRSVGGHRTANNCFGELFGQVMGIKSVMS